MPENPDVGTVVALRDRRLAEQLGRGDEFGVVLQRRRSDARVCFLSDRQTHWIEDARLWPVDAPTPALRRLQRALRILRPEEAQVERADGVRLELHALCTELRADSFAQLQEDLGDALVGWSIQPYGMAFLTVIVELAAD